MIVFKNRDFNKTFEFLLPQDKSDIFKRGGPPMTVSPERTPFLVQGLCICKHLSLLLQLLRALSPSRRLPANDCETFCRSELKKYGAREPFLSQRGR